MVAAAGGSESGRLRLRKRPGAALALAGRAAGASGRRGRAARRGVGSAAGRNRFRGKPAPPAGSESPQAVGGPGRRDKQVVELAPCLPTRPCQCWAEGRPPCVPGGGPDTGGRADVSPRSAALSALSAGRFLPRCSRSCCPGRPGRRWAQLPASRPGASLLCCSPDSGPGKVNGKRAALPVPTSAPGPGRRYLFFPSREAPWTRGLNHHFTPEPEAGLTVKVSPVETGGFGGFFSLLFYLFLPDY